MTKYYITARASRATNKKMERINDLLEGYNKTLVHGDRTKDHIVNGIKELVDEYNEIFRGKPNYITLSGHTRTNDLILSVHTENSDVTSELIFHIVLREIDK